MYDVCICSTYSNRFSLSLVVSWYFVLNLVQAIANTILYRSFSRWTAMCCCITDKQHTNFMTNCFYFVVCFVLCLAHIQHNHPSFIQLYSTHTHTHVHILYSLIFSIVDFKMLVVLRLAVLHSFFFLLLPLYLSFWLSVMFFYYVGDAFVVVINFCAISFPFKLYSIWWERLFYFLCSLFFVFCLVGYFRSLILIYSLE